MTRLIILRKAADKAPKLSVTKITEIKKEVDKNARVKRDALVSFLLDGSYNRLSIVKQSLIDDPERRAEVIPMGWEIPQDSLGRCKGEPTASTRESVRLWIRQNLASYGIDASDVAVMLVD